MTTQDAFERTLALLYEAALTDSKWVPAAASINDLIRTNGHSLSYGDPSPPAPEIYLSRFFVGRERRDDYEELYFRDYYRLDEAIPRLHGLGDGELTYRSDLYTDREKKTSIVYNEFRCAYGTQDGLYIRFEGLDGCAIFLSIGNSIERGGGWRHGQIRTINRLAPHLRQFARVRHAMANAGALSASLTALLENGRSGFIQLDRHGRILDANDRARETLLERDGLCDEAGALAAKTPGENAKLQRLLAGALSPCGSQGAGGTMKITRTATRTPVVIEICPVRPDGGDYRGRGVAALVLLVDPAARPRIDPAFAAAILRLSPKEGRVAVDLAAGQTVAGIAAELDCGESTIRTHVRRIYRKLAVNKQTDLVRRIVSLEALPGSRR